MAKAKNSNAALIAELNDLMKLDHDAVQVYTLAARELKDEGHKSAIEGFKGDHERHITELTGLVTAYGGKPAKLPHASTAPAKLGVQAAGAVGGDVSTLLAFKANERLSRDKYQRAANAGYPADVHAVLARGADDESRHYGWVEDTLQALGAGDETAVGKAEKVVEAGHAGLADAMEGAGKSASYGAEALRRTVTDAFGNVSTRLGNGGTRNVWIALGVGLVASQLVGRRGGSSRSSYASLSGLADSSDSTSAADLSASSTSTGSSRWRSRFGSGRASKRQTAALSSRTLDNRAGYPGWSDSTPLSSESSTATS